MKKHIEKQKKAERHCIHRHDHYRAKLVERWIFRMEFWTPDNKIEQVLKADGLGKDTIISYTYDGLGNRISKSVKITENGNTISEDFTYYIRDVQGNILSTYSKTGASLVLDEQMLYGSDLLGVWKPENNSQSLPPTSYAYFYNRKIGNKQYSIKDHLGNIRVTFADKKIPANGLLQDFVLETQSVSTYYPFGWEIKPLSWAFDTYRFGYNNKEKDGDIGDWIDYGERMYLPKIARFPMPDPIIVYEKKYPELSTYQYASNTPIQAIDLDGLEAYYTESGNVYYGPDKDSKDAYFVYGRKGEVILKKNNKKSIVTELSMVQQYSLKLPSAEVRGKIGDAVYRSDHSTDDDHEGGFHEEGGLWYDDNSVFEADPGKYVQPSIGKVKVKNAEIAVNKRTNADGDPEYAPLGAAGTFHIHPSGVISKSMIDPNNPNNTSISNKSEAVGSNFVQSPHKEDLANHKERVKAGWIKPGGYSIVVGARDKRVYFYNNNGRVGWDGYKYKTLSLSLFLKNTKTKYGQKDDK